MKWISAAIASVVMTGCLAGAPQAESITDVVQAYNESVRWQRFEAAAGRLPPKQRAARVEEWDELSKDVRITEFEIVRIDPGKKEAKAHVKMSWYSDAEQIVHETHSMQTWERKGKSWMIIDEERLRGDKMPGLPEHIEHKHVAKGDKADKADGAKADNADADKSDKADKASADATDADDKAGTDDAPLAQKSR